MKSHNHRPSSMEEHANAIVRARESKPRILIIKADDGDDYSIRSQHNIHLLGRLWRDLELDMIVFIKNAPGDSKYNEVEHLWGFLTPKLAGIMLSRELSNAEREEFDEEVDDLEDYENRTIMDRAVVQVSNLLQDLKFDGQDVNVVTITIAAKSVKIGDKEYSLNTYNDFEKVQEFYKVTKKQLSSRKNKFQEVQREAKLFQKNMDNRTRGVIFRKCCPMLGESECKSCQLKPVQAREAMKILPPRIA